MGEAWDINENTADLDEQRDTSETGTEPASDTTPEEEADVDPRPSERDNDES